MYVLELGMSTSDGGLYLVDNNDGIMKILRKINVDIDVLEFYDNHDVCAPIYAPNINLGANLDKVSLSSEEELDTPPSFEGQVRFLNT